MLKQSKTVKTESVITLSNVCSFGVETPEHTLKLIASLYNKSIQNTIELINKSQVNLTIK